MELLFSEGACGDVTNEDGKKLMDVVKRYTTPPFKSAAKELKAKAYSRILELLHSPPAPRKPWPASTAPARSTG